jgi:hypothetical protein
MAGWRTATLSLALGASTVPAVGVLTTDADICATPAGRLASAAHAAGLPADKVPTAVAVGLAESNGDPSARGDVELMDAKWGPSLGAWQVRSLVAERGTGGVRDELALGDLAHNARSMVAISGGGENWQPWSVFTNGRYAARLEEGQRAAGCVGSAAPVSHGETVANGRPDAAELFNRAATNVIYGVGDRACPASSGAELCARWRAFTAIGQTSVTHITADDGRATVTVDGMTVAVEAAPSLRRMLAAARMDGVELRAVSSLRTADEQWALRVQNCPDPANSPPMECSPPTARVGTSEHETGHAVDFEAGPDGASWRWLAANAERFGWHPTAGIAVEPWHWGFTGGQR